MGGILTRAPSWMQLLSLAACSYGAAAEVKMEPTAAKGRGRTVKCGKRIKVGTLANGARRAPGFGKNGGGEMRNQQQVLPCSQGSGQ